MAIILKNNSFTNCGTVASVPADADLVLDGNSIVNCSNGVVIRDPATVAQFFAVREELVREVLSRLEPYRHADHQEQEAVVRASPFWDAIGKAADLATVLPILLALL